MGTQTQIETETIVTVQGAVQAVVGLALEREVPPSKVAAEIAERVRGRAALDLIRMGLVWAAGSELHDRRRGGPSEDSLESETTSGGEAPVRRSQQPGAPHPADTPAWSAMSALERITLQTADGERMLPLERLGAEDLAANAVRFRERADGYLRKVEFLERALRSVRGAGADRIEELSERTRDKLETLAEEAWK